MNLILFCVFLTFSVGLFLLLSGLLHLPTLKTSRVMMDTGKESKQLSKTLDVFYMDGAVKIAKYIRMNDYKKNRMANVLRASGLGMTPEVYTAYAYLKAGSVFLLIIPALYVFPLAALFVILLGIMIYYKEIQKADEMLKEKREQILLLAEGSHVLWVVGFRISEYYKIEEHTENILQVTCDGGKDYGR